ncbi:MAG: LysM peptidoglycan-binding domain-containing protein [Saprospiraceae bacterium]|nr:LysM peptidoglycan-binding domain-containing protein [Saprospiraceae bacterium]
MTTSLAQETITDAAFVKIDPKLGKVVYHRVLNNQTLYGISRNYGVPQQNIIEANPALSQNKIQLPTILTIPIAEEQIVARLPLFKNRNEFLPVYYQVQTKDNLFRVSRVYFKIPTNLLANRNNLENEQLKTGQALHIGWIKRDFDPLVVETGKIIDPDDAPAPDKPESKTELGLRFSEEYEPANLVSKNEVAFWKATGGARGYFVMHRHADQQSIIEIKNPMHDVTIYAKVVGTIPDHLYPKEVDMVISQEVAQALGAVDAKFFVRSRYKASRASASR